MTQQRLDACNLIFTLAFQLLFLYFVLLNSALNNYDKLIRVSALATRLVLAGSPGTPHYLLFRVYGCKCNLCGLNWPLRLRKSALELSGNANDFHCLSGFPSDTDHKPLVSLIKTQDLDRVPIRCQSLLM